jgi:hypothetical protein
MATAAQATPMKELIFIMLVLHKHRRFFSPSKRIDQDYHSSRVSDVPES